MNNKPYIERLFDKELEFYLKSVGAIQIVGPKWCGKSRTAERYAQTINPPHNDTAPRFNPPQSPPISTI